jgi:hypothetical protein
LLVDPPHQRQFSGIRHRRLAIDPGARQSEQGTLPSHRQIGTAAVDHRHTLGPVHRPDLRDKKSRSTVS